MADVVENAPESGVENYSIPDTDGDTIPDWADRDSDNDGLLDTIETNHIDNNLDGIIDEVVESMEGVLIDNSTAQSSRPLVDETGLAQAAGGIPRDTDGDRLPDFRDGDSDNDGIMDTIESFGISADKNGDGRFDDFIDDDRDGVNDYYSDAPISARDTDADGVIDARQLDADSDGILDIIENGGVDADGNGTVDAFKDIDANGIDDGASLLAQLLVDTDSDGTPDYQDIDSDNDGLTDLAESGARDINGDGFADEPVLGSAFPDYDADGTPDHLESNDPLFIRTGLEGAGCSIAPIDGKSRSIDPALPLMALLAGIGAWFRRKREEASLT